MLSFSPDMIAASGQVFFGKHGSDLRSLLHLFALYTQLPLRDRQALTSLAVSLYKVAEAHGEITDPDGFTPDMDLVEKAQHSGQIAAIKKERSYKV